MNKGDACSREYIGLRVKTMKGLGRAPLCQDELAEQTNWAMNRQDTEKGYGKLHEPGQIVADNLDVEALYVPTGARVGDRVRFFHSNGAAHKVVLLREGEKGWEDLLPEKRATEALGLMSSDAWEELSSQACLKEWAELSAAERDAAWALEYDKETWA